MKDIAQPAGGEPVYLYFPFVDDQGTGMQRFGSEIILALLRTGLNARVLIGELQGQPAWLEGVPYRVIIRARLGRVLPRPAAAIARLLWVQFVLPLRAGRKATLLTLADRDLAIIPLIRQIAVAHDLTQVRSLRQRTGVAHDLRNRLWRGGLKRSEKIIAISDSTKSDLVESFGIPAEQIEVVHEGYDPTVFFPDADGRENSERYLLYAGTLAPNKNIPFLLHIYSEVRRLGIDVKLRLVGRYAAAQAEELRALVPEAYRADVDFAGFVTDEELAEQMRGCAAFVFPSLSEGFGLAPVEAMACGAPVISSNATSLVEVVGEGGALLSPHDEQGWVTEISQVLTDAKYRNELKQRALIRSAAYSWDRAAVSYRMLLER